MRKSGNMTLFEEISMMIKIPNHNAVLSVNDQVMELNFDLSSSESKESLTMVMGTSKEPIIDDTKPSDKNQEPNQNVDTNDSLPSYNEDSLANYADSLPSYVPFLQETSDTSSLSQNQSK